MKKQKKSQPSSQKRITQKPSRSVPAPVLNTSGAVMPEPKPRSLSARIDARKAFGKQR